MQVNLQRGGSDGDSSQIVINHRRNNTLLNERSIGKRGDADLDSVMTPMYTKVQGPGVSRH